MNSFGRNTLFWGKRMSILNQIQCRKYGEESRKGFELSQIEIQEKIGKLLSHDRVTIARTMTLIESTRPDHRSQALQILKALIQKKRSTSSSDLYKSSAPKTIRIGFCGTPGAGKSSLIEKLGLYICNQKKLDLAVLAIDPSSHKTGGAILGDKTRMELLSNHPNAFVRPTPTKGVLGGLALNTNEMIQLCEHSGYDVVIVESVGLGQNEVEIDNVVDMVVYVVPPGSGDSLQGVKKGIMEICDIIAINKFDSEYEKACKTLKVDLQHAIHFQVPRYPGWTIPIVLCSAYKERNLDKIWQYTADFKKANGMEIQKKRYHQSIHNMWNYLSNNLMRTLKDEDDQHSYSQIIKRVTHALLQDESFLPYEGAEYIKNKIFETCPDCDDFESKKKFSGFEKFSDLLKEEKKRKTC